METDQNFQPGDRLSNLPPVKSRGISNKKKFILIGIIIVVLLLVGAIFNRYYLQNKKDQNSALTNFKTLISKKAIEINKQASPINGELVEEAKAKKHVLAISIENHPDARPQSGLNKASAVYEAITEGGITRFLAIFGPNDATEVGPIRSARTFFVDWTSEYRGYFAHAGGAPDALALIPKSPIYDLNHSQDYFVRKQRGNVASEHTLYSSTNDLYQYANSKKYPETDNFETLTFKADAKVEDRGSIIKITIPFSNDQYKVTWDYDKEANKYLRSLAGLPHKDRVTGDQLSAKTIIVQEVLRQQIVPAPGAKQTYQFTTKGSGKATIFEDGKAIEGTWKKNEQKSRTKYFDSNGDEIKINRGQIWYEIIPPDVTITSI